MSSRVGRVVLLGLVAATGLALAPRGPAFTLAILRRDGLITPFAAFNGRRWSSPWPVSARGAESLPIGLADVPPKWWGPVGPDAAWTAVVPDRPPQPLKLLAPVVTRVFCSQQLQIRTDYSGGPIGLPQPTAVKDGIAVAGPVAVTPLPAVSVLTAEARDYVGTITDTFNDQERTAAHHFTSWRHPFTDAERRTYPITLEALYRHHESSPRGEWTTAYLEAVRKFPPGAGDQGCGLITFVRGWVITSEGHAPVINLGARVTYCDRANVAFMLPFGEITADGEHYWVYQMSSWRDEVYSVTRVRPDGIAPQVAVAGGTCPR